ncbi:MAG: DUF2520 domain-containing protein [Undibacterium sp.]|nr:DUF2520 domain-containing protein [Undibacterium sp.]
MNSFSTLSLSIIGAGRVGQSLGHLFSQLKVFDVAQIYTQNEESNDVALQFIGAGRGIHKLDQLEPSDVIMIAVPDDHIATIAQYLLTHNLLRRGQLVFHCSGAQSSKLLAPLRAAEVHVASVHPVRSFAQPRSAVEDFCGTICSIEGDHLALAILMPAFSAIGGQILAIATENKLLYHAGSVFASNYLVSLMDMAMNTYCAAGVSPEMATAMAKSLALQSIDNVFKLGTAAALTGPIKRGDTQLVTQQAELVKAWDAPAGELYQAFIAPTTSLAKRAF